MDNKRAITAMPIANCLWICNLDRGYAKISTKAE